MSGRLADPDKRGSGRCVWHGHVFVQHPFYAGV